MMGREISEITSAAQIENNSKKPLQSKRSSYGAMLKRDLIRNKYVYIMAIPMILYFLIFLYIPMYGAIIAFKYYDVADGILASSWAGLDHFVRFFNSPYFKRLILNTLTINLMMLMFAFPPPIIFALLLNEIRQTRLKRIFQTVSYLPHFISIVVVCGMITQFTNADGIINDFLKYFFNIQQSSLLLNPNLFRPIYVISGIWQTMGWESIIYLGALSAIDCSLYEAAKIDGASRWKQTVHITVPGIAPTIIIMLILRIGQLMNVGFEKVMLLYNANTMDKADVISTYVYRVGIINFNYDYSTAIGIFNAVINLTLLIMANYFSRKINDTGLW